MYEDQLSSATQALRESGCLSLVLGLIDEVWLDNLARYDPFKGDDTRTLGFSTAANISNRLLRDARLRGCEGVEVVAVEGWAMVKVADLDLKVYKLPGLRADVSPYVADWTGSDTKERGARENSHAHQLVLFGADDASSLPEPHLHRLHLVHTADQETGEVVTFLGFPRLDDVGEGPWYAVAAVTAAAEPVEDQPAANPETAETYDQLPKPEVPIAMRRPDDAVGEQ